MDLQKLRKEETLAMRKRLIGYVKMNPDWDFLTFCCALLLVQTMLHRTVGSEDTDT